ncbi:helix-turn-helix domain-containing protein [Terasakiella pusilla]|uniref:helix-turn-helix domain-containing protein n=1 Tax=Terasakiella pusilla TaxID=64973 RepID=UPI003AA97312
MGLYSSKQAASFLGCSVRTLQRWRQHQEGPPYIRQVGRVFYDKTDLERWVYQNRRL